MEVSIEHGLGGAETAVLRGDAIVIVDAIRASTTYVCAFANGASRIIPCSSREHLSEKFEDYPNSLKCGERLCKKIEGYDLGSSPVEMSSTDLTGKVLLSSTTNGSRMVVACRDSPVVVMGGFCNASSVAEFLKGENRDISIICSGRLGDEVVEDNLCAEFIKHILVSSSQPFRFSQDEIREECLASPSYQMLEKAGLEKDFEKCMSFDSHSLVPVFDGEAFIVDRDKK